MIKNDEFLDLVDKNDNVVGTELRSKVYLKDFKNIRVVNVFVVNSKGEIWFPRRVASKRFFPLCLDMSVGGHVGSGETYEDALKHEVRDEINIDIEKTPFKFLGKLSPYENDVSAFMKVYEIRSDEVPDYNKKDFCECFWLTPKAFFERLAKGEKTKEDLPKLVKYFYCEN
jgi:isopentenyl-diphosphate delta-isomerase